MDDALEVFVAVNWTVAVPPSLSVAGEPETEQVRSLEGDLQNTVIVLA